MIGIYNLHKETHTACLLVECFHCRRAALTVSAKLCLHHPQTILQPHTSSPQKAWITNNNRSLLFVYNQSPLPKKMYSSKVVGALLQAIWGSLDSFREKKPSTRGITHIWVVWNRWMPSVTSESIDSGGVHWCCALENTLEIDGCLYIPSRFEYIIINWGIICVNFYIIT